MLFFSDCKYISFFAFAEIYTVFFRKKWAKPIFPVLKSNFLSKYHKYL